MPTQTKSTHSSKKAMFHNEETKLAALRKVQTLINSGMSRFRAQGTIAEELDVRTQTVVNWFNKYNVRNGDHISSNHALTSTGRLVIQSLNVKTADGKCITLTPSDIKDIAEYASLV